jgi:plastocyanin
MRRRELLKAGGALLAGAALPAAWLYAAPVVEIRMVSDEAGGHVSFDPIGLYIEPGQRVRWINVANVHTVTAYHPSNDNHALRIPEQAEPWDSGYLIEPGASFERRFDVPGVYDYYCAPHEAAGMVGRLVVGHASGPGALPFEYFRADPAKRHWRPVPPAARQQLPSVDTILELRRVR